MNYRKIKVAWICQISNQQIRNKLKFYKYTPMALLRMFYGNIFQHDCAKWNTNAIEEFEKFDDIELHIISPHLYISRLQEFSINNIHYHIFNSEDDNVIDVLKTRVLKKKRTNYNKNSKTINRLIERINPDIVQMIGAENPFYSESALLLSRKRPFIITLQTLMNDPDFLANYPITEESYNYRSEIERKIIVKADYIASKVLLFRKIIKDKIKPDAIFLDMNLAVGEKVMENNDDRSYDFVYFAADISKAVDYTIEVFALTKKKHPDITLLVVGGYSDSLMQQLKVRMRELDLGDEIKFIGRPNTHADVMKEIRKARFAVIPLKIDLISCTIRESMANGLPVVTTITPSTPSLNRDRNCILLSEKYDYQAMADNMCLLLENPELVSELIENSTKTINEKYSNASFMKDWRDEYYKILNRKHDKNS